MDAESMQAWQVTKSGEPRDVLELGEAPTPEPGRGEMRLRVKAAGLGFPDVMMCRGNYEYRPSPPFTPGQEVSGIVEATGAGVSWAVGDRVMAITAFFDGRGGFAERAIAVEGMAYRVPETMSDVEAAGFAIPFHTAWVALAVRGGLRPGETLVVLGAAGGCGAAAVNLGRALGARVIAVAGGADKLEQCRRQGATDLVDHRVRNIAEAVRELTSGRGADLVFDPVGGDLAEQSARYLAREGRLLLVGSAGGRWGIPGARELLLGNGSVQGVFVGGYASEERRAMHENLLELYESGAIRVPVGRELPFDRIPEGLHAIAVRAAAGKLVATLR